MLEKIKKNTLFQFIYVSLFTSDSGWSIKISREILYFVSYFAEARELRSSTKDFFFPVSINKNFKQINKKWTFGRSNAKTLITYSGFVTLGKGGK